MRKLIWYERILIAVISGAAYTIIAFITNWNFGEMNIKHILLEGLLFTVFFGFGFPLLMQKLTNKQLEKIKKPDLNENETIIKEDGVNLFHNFFNALGGKLFLTEKRLIFNSHKLNIPNSSVTIQLDDISNIIGRRTLGIVNNGLRIETKEGVKYDFVVNDRKSWIERLKR